MSQFGWSDPSRAQTGGCAAGMMQKDAGKEVRVQRGMNVSAQQSSSLLPLDRRAQTNGSIGCCCQGCVGRKDARNDKAQQDGKASESRGIKEVSDPELSDARTNVSFPVVGRQ